MKRIWATSDLHGMLEGLTEPECSPKGCDLAVIAGDLAPLGNFETWQDQVRWFISSGPKLREIFGSVPVALVPGNHDLWLKPEHLAEWNEGGKLFPFGETTGWHLLIDACWRINGITVHGSPWIPYINGGWAYEAPRADDGKFLTERFSSIPEGLDVLVTHTPPLVNHATLDVSTFHGGRTTRHFGSPELKDAIERAKPKLAISGHIHSGMKEPLLLGSTVLRNVSRVDEDYRIAYEPAVLEIQ